MTACCCIEYDGADAAVTSSRREVAKSRAEHICCECRRLIPIGAPYRYETALFRDSGWTSYHTCKLCASIRDDRMECGHTWCGLWEDLRYCLDDQPGCDCEDDCDCDSWLDPPDWPIEVTP